jgi:hypothetical protein
MVKFVKRPLGVSGIAVVECAITVSGVLLIVGSLTYFSFKGGPDTPEGAEFFGAAIECALISVFAAAGHALWKFKNWGRVCTVSLASLIVAVCVWRVLSRTWFRQYDMIIGALTPSADHFPFYTALDLTLIACSSWAVWYLLRPSVKNLFVISGVLDL